MINQMCVTSIDMNFFITHDCPYSPDVICPFQLIFFSFFPLLFCDCLAVPLKNQRHLAPGSSGSQWTSSQNKNKAEQRQANMDT